MYINNKSGKEVEQKCLYADRRSRDHVVRQTVPYGGSGDWEGPTANGRQFNGQH